MGKQSLDLLSNRLSIWVNYSSRQTIAMYHLDSHADALIINYVINHFSKSSKDLSFNALVCERVALRCSAS